VSFIEKINKEAIKLGDDLRDNFALDSIAKSQIIKSLQEFESFVLSAYAESQKEEKQKLRQIIDKEAWTTEMVRSIGQKKGTLWIEVKKLEEIYINFIRESLECCETYENEKFGEINPCL
jgi:hypothetical protein